MEPKFESGKFVRSKGVIKMLAKTPSFHEHFSVCLLRHIYGDWGDIDEADRLENENSLKNGGELISCYENWIWVITSADRTVTTMLCRDDF
jgi:hypothetical protein